MRANPFDERDGKKIIIVDPKAHGLGYLCPPASDADRVSACETACGGQDYGTAPAD